MKQTKTLAQVANDIENGNNLHEYYNNDGATIKAGNFESFGDFLSYFDMHYRPLLERIENGEDISESDRHLLNFLASDLLAAFKTEDSDESEDEEDPTLTEAEKRDTLCRLWDAAWHQAKADPKTYRVIVETNEADPTAPANEFGRYYMIDFWSEENTGEGVGRWVVIRSDVVTSPFEVRRPNWHTAEGYDDRATQPHCRVSNRNNLVRWALRMIDAGRVTDIYADRY